MSIFYKLRVNKLASAIIIIILLIVVVYIVDKMSRCSRNGLAHNDAVKIAEKKLKRQFKSQPFVKEFILVGEQFESDKSWLFFYKVKDCSVHISIDQCGVADVAGLSEKCDGQVQTRAK